MRARCAWPRCPSRPAPVARASAPMWSMAAVIRLPCAAGAKLGGRWHCHTRPHPYVRGHRHRIRRGDVHSSPPKERSVLGLGAPARLLYRQPVGLYAVVDPLPGAMIEREEALRIHASSPGASRCVHVTTTPHILRSHDRVVGGSAAACSLNRCHPGAPGQPTWARGADSNVALVIDAAADRRPCPQPALRRTLRSCLHGRGRVPGALARAPAPRRTRPPVAMVTFDLGTGRTSGFSTAGRTGCDGRHRCGPRRCSRSVLRTHDRGLLAPTTMTSRGGRPNFVAIRRCPVCAELSRRPDTFDSVDARELKHNTAIAAVFVWELANALRARSPPEPRRVEQLGSRSGLPGNAHLRVLEDLSQESVVECPPEGAPSPSGSESWEPYPTAANSPRALESSSLRGSSQCAPALAARYSMTCPPSWSSPC
jgi:hypothetical protein